MQLCKQSKNEDKQKIFVWCCLKKKKKKQKKKKKKKKDGLDVSSARAARSDASTI
jgi:hypothetical protein